LPDPAIPAHSVNQNTVTETQAAGKAGVVPDVAPSGAALHNYAAPQQDVAAVLLLKPISIPMTRTTMGLLSLCGDAGLEVAADVLASPAVRACASCIASSMDGCIAELFRTNSHKK